MARRDRSDDTPPHNLICQLAVAPLADRPVRVGWLLACQGDDLAHLLGGEFRRSTRTRSIRQPFGHTDFLHWYIPKLEPALAPEARRLVIQSKPPRDLRIVLSVASRQDDPSARHQLLGRSVGPYQALQLISLELAQHDLRGPQ